METSNTNDREKMAKNNNSSLKTMTNLLMFKPQSENLNEYMKPAKH